MIELVPNPSLPLLALATGIGAAIVWFLVLVRAVIAYRKHVEHRGISWIIMPVGAFVTAIGTTASAIGSAIGRGTIVVDINLDTLSLIASMGRGALLMSGIIVLAHYRPPQR